MSLHYFSREAVALLTKRTRRDRTVVKWMMALAARTGEFLVVFLNFNTLTWPHVSLAALQFPS